jgi:hypothetical protein
LLSEGSATPSFNQPIFIASGVITLARFVISMLAVVLFASATQAQVGPVIWTQPAPVVWSQSAPVIWQQPAPVFLPSMGTTIVTPINVSPVNVSPVIVPQRPQIVSTFPVTRVYRAPIVTYQPTRQVITRQRPIIGGTVSRSRYGYRRVAF